jgi:pimeloyl-ACP methyl ester carboxylesterase
MQVVRAIWEFKTYERLKRVRCPAACVQAIPTETEHLSQKQRGVEKARQALPGLVVHWLADTVHDIPLHRPEELARMIAAFAADVPPGS